MNSYEVQTRLDFVIRAHVNTFVSVERGQTSSAAIEIVKEQLLESPRDVLNYDIDIDNLEVE
ncbi:hypothetical protein EX326_05860 [Staphylococcus epidermidis]|uniref:hypothetical protein n=1 Tax=Staphylococcus epidermidis TaxID=1282 RepID=UPI001370A5E4|nr:hypothetical protein [Staphylococcus epidermidis]MDT0712820.1 hypothetical protein [Staphylococcus epidermidis]MEB6269205.1 hypothetical protein [Staphylococcus epidermidis]NAN67707.1 hypothetical protein [Staphylococcus epidermidis]NAN79979.1 hypothetical protein [Staphylococcus epidermidis]NAN89881.1 hypothetical protein [Staphylococcus epidermidis]